MFLKMLLGRDPAIDMGIWAKNDGPVVTQAALAHFKYVDVLWR